MEAAVLGAIMLESWSLNTVLEIIQDPEVFYNDANKKIFEAIQKTSLDGYPVDLMTVINTLIKTGNLEVIGGPSYLTELMSDMVSSANIESHSRILVEKYMAREQIRIGGLMMSRGYDSTEDIFDSLEQAENDLFQLVHSTAKNDVLTIADAMATLALEMEIKRQQKSNITGITTGFHDLNRITGGLQKKTVTIIAARPAMGKTAFALALAKGCINSNENGGAVLFFTLEMGASELLNRMISELSEVNLTNVLTPALRTPSEEARIVEAMITLARKPFFIDDTAGLNLMELRGKARRMKAKHDVQLVILDYLQLMTGDTNKSTNREQEVSKISRELKKLAKELDVAMVALSQLNRGIENRSDNTPKLADLRESGAIEQDADLVVMLWRPSETEQKADPMLENTGKAWVLKNRSGPTDDFALQANMSIQRWADMHQERAWTTYQAIEKKMEPKPGSVYVPQETEKFHEVPAQQAPDDLPF